jgi:hypothetical protein
MSYGRYKRILLLKRVEVTTARMQKVPSHGARKVEARTEQRLRIMQEQRTGVKSTSHNPLSLEEEVALTCVDTDTLRED